LALRFSRLDRLAIRRLKPCERITEHGITAERLADGDLRYSVNVMVDGKRIHRVVGEASDGVTRTQCENFIEKVSTEARADRLSLPKGRKLALTFGAAADAYIERLRQTAGKNIAIKDRQLRMYLKPFFGALRLDAIAGFTSIDTRKSASMRGRPTPPSIVSSRRSPIYSRWQSTRPAPVPIADAGGKPRPHHRAEQ
jgi:hypothetical protein